MAISIHKLFAENLKRLRKAKGYSQDRLATETNLSLRYIQNLEAADRWPSPETVRDLARVLQCKQTDFFK